MNFFSEIATFKLCYPHASKYIYSNGLRRSCLAI
jgi:hypothetical protein